MSLDSIKSDKQLCNIAMLGQTAVHMLFCLIYKTAIGCVSVSITHTRANLKWPLTW